CCSYGSGTTYIF
nr:immunoglobulin light chain junction region [Macaca mulatta]MPO04212.1 immunoglobulin light chain junction region [Macaca mulatta]MPO04295.1 immunoglobulin light chain junction region [Macaca mulatta]MPO05295.1 immunoglobulin light chain junction region [Macaca mulatta]MPO05734.1 immunoglobulin light chain junction region [Macaca mulatta]